MLHYVTNCNYKIYENIEKKYNAYYSKNEKKITPKSLIMNWKYEKLKTVTKNLKHTIAEWIHFSFMCVYKDQNSPRPNVVLMQVVDGSFIHFCMLVTWPYGDPYV